MVNTIVSRMAEDDDLIGLKAAAAFQLALVGNGNLKDEDFKQAQERSKELFQEILNTLSPWDRMSLADIKNKEIQGLIDAYKAKFGDPDDPVVRHRLDEGLKRHYEQMAASPKESDEQRVERLVRERDAARRNATNARRR